MTAEKQTPSALDFLGAMTQAVTVERKRAKSGQSKALKDLLNKAVGAYNALCTQKKHRVDASKKGLIYNLFPG